MSRFADIKTEEIADLSTLSLQRVFTSVLINRDLSYVNMLVKKLTQQDIKESRQLVQVSREGIEKLLGNTQGFNLGETSDVIAVHAALQNSPTNNRNMQDDKKGSGKIICGQHDDRRRSRSSRRSSNRDGLHDDNKGFGKSKRGRRQYRNRSRSGQDGRHIGKGPIHEHGVKGRSKGDKPEKVLELPSFLWKATETGNVNECKNLLEDHSIDVDKGYKHWTPLMKASEEGYVEIARLLLDRGADIQATNRKGRDALSFAAAPSMKKPWTEGHRYVLTLLFERGADPSRRDERGQTALDRARQEGREESVNCLEDIMRGFVA